MFRIVLNINIYLTKCILYVRIVFFCILAKKNTDNETYRI